MKKRLVGTVIVIVMLVICFLRFEQVYSFKHIDGNIVQESFYSLEKDSLDVLFVGSSHVYMNINPTVFWDTHGIASYNLANSFAPMWASYYNIVEALKTQKPKVIVLDAFALIYDNEYSDGPVTVKNTFGMRQSIDRLRLMQANNHESVIKSYILKFFSYHNRYAELTKEDYKKYHNDEAFESCYLGYTPNNSPFVVDVQNIENNSTDRVGEINKKVEEYYRKIIDLCKDEGIELFVVVAPFYGGSEEDLAAINKGRVIAEENGFPFWDFNRLGIFDPLTDYSDTTHLNYIGAKKYSNFLADTLTALYELPDHKLDSASKYDRYKQSSEFFKYYDCDVELQRINNMDEYVEYLKTLPENFLVILNGKADSYANNSSGLFELMNVGAEYSGDCAFVWNGKTTTQYTKNKYGYCFCEKYRDKELLIDEEGIFWDGENYESDLSRSNVVVFDIVTGSIADSFYYEDNRIYR